MGGDHHDEVWEGTYMMTPLPNNEHQDFVFELGLVLHEVVGKPGLGVVRTVNVSDREHGWEHNYRCPDIAVMLKGGRAKNCGTHWVGGPDFLVEIVSPDDNTFDKLPFYSRIGVRELLVIDRDPWELSLYRLQQDSLTLVATARPTDEATVDSEVLPLSFRLLDDDPRPTVEIVHQKSGQRWHL